MAHFLRFSACIFRAIALWNLLRPVLCWDKRDLPHFPRIGFKSLISNI